MKNPLTTFFELVKRGSQFALLLLLGFFLLYPDQCEYHYHPRAAQKTVPASQQAAQVMEEAPPDVHGIRLRHRLQHLQSESFNLSNFKALQYNSVQNHLSLKISQILASASPPSPVRLLYCILII